MSAKEGKAIIITDSYTVYGLQGRGRNPRPTAPHTNALPTAITRAGLNELEILN